MEASENTAEERHRPWHPAWLLAGVAAFCVLWISSGPLWQSVKVRQARRLARFGESCAASNDWSGAGRYLRSALRQAPAEPEVLRLAARFCTTTGLPEALDYWDRLLAGPGATVEDRRAFVRAAHSLGRLDRSASMVQALIREDPDDRFNQWLLLDQLVLVGNIPAAITAARLSRETRPGDPVRALTLARVLLLTRDARDGAEALGILRPIARKGEAELRRQALRMMADLEGLDRTEEAWVADELEGLKAAAVTDRWAAVELRVRSDSARGRAIVRAAVDRELRAGPAVDDRLEICRWLRGHGLAEEAPPLLPSEMVATNQPMALAWIELLGDLRRWSDLERFAAEGSAQLDPLSVDCAVALAATGRGDMEAAVRRLDAAASRCVRRPDQLLQLAVFAEQIGQTDTAVLVWLTALRQAGLEAVAGPRLLRLIRDRQAAGIGKAVENVEMERAVYVALARVFGAEPVVQAQLAYLDALLGENLPETLRRIGPLSADNPEVLPFRAIGALAELRMGRNEAALGRLEAARVDWSVQEPRWRAVHAAVLRANRLEDRARRAVAGLAAAQLRPLELALVGDLLATPAR